MPTTYTPLRYPGGKSRLAPYLELIIKHNNLNECTYIEPFAGGAGAALRLLIRGAVSKIVLNDIDSRIYAFWHSVLYNTDAMCALIDETPVTLDEWERQREIAHQKPNSSSLALGFAALFLNRTNRSGIIEGGVVGGRKQTGKWKIDARFNRATLIRKIKYISSLKNRISLSSSDALKFIKHGVSGFQKPVFLYLDPPFYNQGRSLYENHYSGVDHKRLAQALRSMDLCNWLVSYDDVQAIRDLYLGCNAESYSLSYSAANRYKGKEIMFFSPSVRRPSWGFNGNSSIEWEA